MATVTIAVHDGTLTVVPPRVKINPNDLSIIWNLAGAGGWTFSSTRAGIVCEPAPAPPFQPWSGTAAVPGPGPHQYTAKASAVTGETLYKYSIYLENGAGQTII